MPDRTVSLLLASTLVSPGVFLLGMIITGIKLIGLYPVFKDAKPAPIATMHGWPSADDSLTYHPQKQR